MVVPGVGEIAVGNLTLSQADDEFYARLRTVYSGLARGPGATTHFSLTVARLHTNQVYVLGDVAEPGSYRVSSAGTALTALYAAGGPTSDGGMRRIEIRRGGRVVDSLDVYDYLLHGDASRDVRLQSGDVVFVPVHGPRVRVYGEIERPATYSFGAERRWATCWPTPAGTPRRRTDGGCRSNAYCRRPSAIRRGQRGWCSTWAAARRVRRRRFRSRPATWCGCFR